METQGEARDSSGCMVLPFGASTSTLICIPESFFASLFSPPPFFDVLDVFLMMNIRTNICMMTSTCKSIG